MTDTFEKTQTLLDEFARRLSITDAYQRGQIAERFMIVAWLRANRPSDAGAAGFAAYVINAIEAGEHLK
jgi:hypothetical protein